MRTAALLSLAASLLVAACSSGQATAESAADPAPVQIGRETTATASVEAIRTGPAISGQLEAERRATVRAEVGGAIIRTSVEEGQPVRQGAVIARIEARDLNDAVTSAQVGVKSAESALALASSEARRAEALVAAGAVAERELENARAAVANAESQVAAARARLASAQAQLADTVVRAPIGGIVSNKAVNTGDVITPGSELYTIIDPSSMQLAASVPSEQIGSLRAGVPVEFTVRGYENQTFSGRIERIGPTADPSTRQVRIWVSIPNKTGRLIAGLYAEGRVETEGRRALVVPGNAIDAASGRAAAMRVREGKAERVDVTLGISDPATERVEVTSGLAEGDLLLIGPARTITPGTPVLVK